MSESDDLNVACQTNRREHGDFNEHRSFDQYVAMTSETQQHLCWQHTPADAGMPRANVRHPWASVVLRKLIFHGLCISCTSLL